MFKFNRSMYPSSYGWLTKKQQNEILNWFKYEDSLMQGAEELQNDMLHNDITEICSLGKNLYNSRIQAAKSILSVIDVYVEYGWKDHENEYFLATYDDAAKHAKELEEKIQ